MIIPSKVSDMKKHVTFCIKIKVKKPSIELDIVVRFLTSELGYDASKLNNLKVLD